MGKENFESSLPRKIEQENIEPKLPESRGNGNYITKTW